MTLTTYDSEHYKYTLTPYTGETNFSRRHYRIIAATLGVLQSKALAVNALTPEQVIETFVNLFTNDNSNFKPDVFRKAIAESEEDYTCTNQYSK